MSISTDVSAEHQPEPLVTVVVPVYNRESGLRRALASLAVQTYADFECLVVDDGSTVDLALIVKELDDERFVFLRQTENRGPTSVRRHGYRAMRGELLTGLDSDDEAMPNMIERGVWHLTRNPEVDGVAGMIETGSDRHRSLRVRGGQRVVTPELYRSLSPLPDCIPMVRRVVVEEWLQKRDDYFALEGHLWFTFHLRHSMLFVDEVWVRVGTDESHRVTTATDSRQLDDFVVFLEEHEEYLDIESVALDHQIADGWLVLKRAGRADDAARFADVMGRRGLRRSDVYVRRGVAKALRKLGWQRTRQL